MPTDDTKAGAEMDARKPYRCSKCGGAEHFVSGRDKRRICRPCHREQGSLWRKANPEKHNRKHRTTEEGREKSRKYRRRWALQNRYGITAEQYEEMGIAQDWTCPICGVVSNNLHVDHCHSTGRIRGLLCRRCNPGIAMFDEDPKRLMRAVEYCLAALAAMGDR